MEKFTARAINNPARGDLYVAEIVGEKATLIARCTSLVIARHLADTHNGLSREKYWQQKAGRFAGIAHWALTELLSHKHSNHDHELANEYLDEIINSGALEFEEEIEPDDYTTDEE